MRTWRIVLATGGIALALFGCFRLATQLPVATLIALGSWLVAALIIHDGILSPAVVAVGWLLRTHVPDRGRRYLQGALIVTGSATVIALPMIYLRGSQPEVKALLLRDYGLNLTLIVGAVAVCSMLLYAVRVARDRTSPPGPGTEPAPESGSDQP
jgi:hypothetical protein